MRAVSTGVPHFTLTARNSMSLFVLLSRTPGDPDSELRRRIAAAGFSILDHALGSTPGVDFAPVLVAVIEVGGKVDVAAAQTRRWRAEHGDDLIPILWVAPARSRDVAVAGLDAGADAVMECSIDVEVLSAQLRSAARLRATASRVAARAAEARLLGEQLQKAYAEIDRELDAARRVHQAFLPRTLPSLGSARFAVEHRNRTSSGGDFFDVRILDEAHIGFFLGSVVGCGTAGSLIGVFVALSIAMKKMEAGSERIIPPGEVLARVNQELLRLSFDDWPLVALLAAVVDRNSGKVTLARAGMPQPVHVPAAGEARALALDGPFLGTADASYSTLALRLSRGDRLVLGSPGVRIDSEPAPGVNQDLLDAAASERGQSGQAFVDAIARDLLAQVQHGDDFTVLCLEWAA